LNNKNTPTVEELKTVYTHLDITSDLKKYRKEYRRMLKKVKLDDQQDLFEEN